MTAHERSAPPDKWRSSSAALAARGAVRVPSPRPTRRSVSPGVHAAARRVGPAADARRRSCTTAPHQAKAVRAPAAPVAAAARPAGTHSGAKGVHAAGDVLDPSMAAAAPRAYHAQEGAESQSWRVRREMFDLRGAKHMLPAYVSPRRHASPEREAGTTRQLSGSRSPPPERSGTGDTTAAADWEARRAEMAATHRSALSGWVDAFRDQPRGVRVLGDDTVRPTTSAARRSHTQPFSQPAPAAAANPPVPRPLPGDGPPEAARRSYSNPYSGPGLAAPPAALVPPLKNMPTLGMSDGDADDEDVYHVPAPSAPPATVSALRRAARQPAFDGPADATLSMSDLQRPVTAPALRIVHLPDGSRAVARSGSVSPPAVSPRGPQTGAGVGLSPRGRVTDHHQQPRPQPQAHPQPHSASIVTRLKPSPADAPEPGHGTAQSGPTPGYLRSPRAVTRRTSPRADTAAEPAPTPRVGFGTFRVLAPNGVALRGSMHYPDRSTKLHGPPRGALLTATVMNGAWLRLGAGAFVPLEAEDGTPLFENVTDRAPGDKVWSLATAATLEKPGGAATPRPVQQKPKAKVKTPSATPRAHPPRNVERLSVVTEPRKSTGAQAEAPPRKSTASAARGARKVAKPAAPAPAPTAPSPGAGPEVPNPLGCLSPRHRGAAPTAAPPGEATVYPRAMVPVPTDGAAPCGRVLSASAYSAPSGGVSRQPSEAGVSQPEGEPPAPSPSTDGASMAADRNFRRTLSAEASAPRPFHRTLSMVRSDSEERRAAAARTAEPAAAAAACAAPAEARFDVEELARASAPMLGLAVASSVEADEGRIISASGSSSAGLSSLHSDGVRSAREKLRRAERALQCLGADDASSLAEIKDALLLAHQQLAECVGSLPTPSPQSAPMSFSTSPTGTTVSADVWDPKQTRARAAHPPTDARDERTHAPLQGAEDCDYPADSSAPSQRVACEVQESSTPGTAPIHHKAHPARPGYCVGSDADVLPPPPHHAAYYTDLPTTPPRPGDARPSPVTTPVRSHPAASGPSSPCPVACTRVPQPHPHQPPVPPPPPLPSTPPSTVRSTATSKKATKRTKKVRRALKGTKDENEHRADPEATHASKGKAASSRRIHF